MNAGKGGVPVVTLLQMSHTAGAGVARRILRLHQQVLLGPHLPVPTARRSAPGPVLLSEWNITLRMACSSSWPRQQKAKSMCEIYKMRMVDESP